MVGVAKVAMGYSIQRIEGLKDEDGNDVQYVDSDEFVNGLSIGVLQQIVHEIVKAGNLEERYAKKS